MAATGVDEFTSIKYGLKDEGKAELRDSVHRGKILRRAAQQIGEKSGKIMT